MRIKKDIVTQKLAFVGIDSSDHISRKTALSSFTVYYSLNGGSAIMMTTPTIAELDATNMAGDYTLLVDEAGMVSTAGELTFHITATGMDPVTRIVEITTNLESDIETSIAALNNISVANIIAGITDDSYDLQEMIRIMFAALSGKSSGGGTTTLAFRDAADNKNRISETVDSTGNRTSVTRDGS